MPVPGMLEKGISTHDLLKASYLRCRQTNQLAECHYKAFLDSHPDVPKYFATINRPEHLLLLRAMHSVLCRLWDGGDLISATMLRLERKHGPDGLDIPKALYRYWMESLISGVSQCNPDFDSAVEDAWRSVGQHAIDLISHEHDDRGQARRPLRPPG